MMRLILEGNNLLTYRQKKFVFVFFRSTVGWQSTSEDEVRSNLQKIPNVFVFHANNCGPARGTKRFL